MRLAEMIKKMGPSEAELRIPAKHRYRMVILGSSKVGKTAIVSRFLTGRFDDQYTPTIEDFHRKFYSIRGEVYQLDILDTSGNHPFPAMRRLSILTDRGDQVLPQEQDQGERGGAAGHLRQQGRPGLLPRGRAPGDRAAGGPRSQEVRLLRDLGQEEQQPGPDVPGPLRHGQAAQRDEPGPPPQGLHPVLRTPAEKGPEGQETPEGGGGRGGLRHPGPLCPPPQRAQRPHVHPGEGRPGRAGERQGALRDQLRPAGLSGLLLPKAASPTPLGHCASDVPAFGGRGPFFTCLGRKMACCGGDTLPGEERLWTGGETFLEAGNRSR
ncbi:dexamethasone-induced Ras-related protein 1 isoform X2 [Paroedura picta]|uniref:dexamethasone-induced Ras-related protein 1 isoform X2 n=1 Tax=Paroedura picta TaxID=143630 RepID=UPI004055AE34